MKYLVFSCFIILSFCYSQCDDLLESHCTINSDCEWVEDTYYESCSNLDSDSCTQADCNWYCDSTYTWLCYCTGGNYEIDNSYCQEIETIECSEMSQLQCMQDVECDWMQSGMENASCYSLDSSSQCNAIADCSWTSYQQECNWSGSQECESYPGCSYSYLTYSCSGTTTISYCSGGNYEAPVYSCEEVEEWECTEMYQSQCDQNSGCEWVEDMEWGSCSNLNPYMNNGVSYCNDPSTNTDNCYIYTCYGGGYGQWNTCCGGGSYLIDNNSYCEEVSFLPGDVNGDGSLNVSDIVLMVDLILNSEYHEYSDMNQDGILNVIDIVELVSIILNS